MQTKIPSSPRRLGTIRDAAELLAVDPSTVRRYIAQGHLRAYRVGNHLLRVDLADVDRLARPIPTTGATDQ